MGKHSLPKALARDIALEAVQWKKGKIITIDDFFSKYTLHDSYLIGLHLDTSGDGSATAIISFDNYWNKVGIPRGFFSTWPILLIRFPGVACIKLFGYEERDPMQGSIIGAESEKFGDGTHIITSIEGHWDGNKVTIMHRDPVKILFFKPNGERFEPSE